MNTDQAFSKIRNDSEFVELVRKHTRRNIMLMSFRYQTGQIDIPACPMVMKSFFKKLKDNGGLGLLSLFYSIPSMSRPDLMLYFKERERITEDTGPFSGETFAQSLAKISKEISVSSEYLKETEIL